MNSTDSLIKNLSPDTIERMTVGNRSKQIKVHSDRSRVVQFRQCHRRRFYEYELILPEDTPGVTAGVAGIVPVRPNIDFAIGSGVHKGLEVIHFRLVERGPVGIDEAVLDEAITAGLAEYAAAVDEYEQSLLLDVDSLAQDEFFDRAIGSPGPEQSAAHLYHVKEGRAMVEGLITVYYYIGLSYLGQRYKIISVEEEVSFEVGEISREVDGAVISLDFNARWDALLMDASNNPSILSIKTAKAVDARTNDNWRVNSQGNSEIIALLELIKQGKVPEIAPDAQVLPGVQMLYLLKGKAYEDEKDGIRKYSNPITRPARLLMPDGEVELRPKWRWLVPETGKYTTLSAAKGWAMVPIWELIEAGYLGSVKEWVEQMLQDYRDILEELVVFPEVGYRTDDQLDEWLASMSYQELAIAGISTNPMLYADQEVLTHALLTTFSKNDDACSYPTKCIYQPLCHEGLLPELLNNGLVQLSGLYKPRQANHPQEGA